MAKTALVTGSSRGIGLALCRELHSRGWQVIATCRNPAAIESEPFYRKLELAVDQDDSIERMAAEVGPAAVDLLINNAGVYTRGQDKLGELTRQSLLDELNTDAVSPLLVTKALLGNLEACKGTVINISSLYGSISDCSTPNAYAYRSAKAALNMATKVLALEKRDTLGMVAAVHPGWVQTDMTGRQGHIGPEEAAKCIVDTITSLAPEHHGCLVSRVGKIEPW